jgi:hypothetical protein
MSSIDNKSNIAGGTMTISPATAGFRCQKICSDLAFYSIQTYTKGNLSGERKHAQCGPRRPPSSSRLSQAARAVRSSWPRMRFARRVAVRSVSSTTANAEPALRRARVTPHCEAARTHQIVDGAHSISNAPERREP